MAIRDFTSAQSGVEDQEKKWFQRADLFEQDMHRFMYMKKGTRNSSWNMKVDLSKETNLKETKWMIDHDKFVNRPDMIAHKFYGNSKYWWIIAERNGITDPFHGFHKGRNLMIPDINALRITLGI